MMLLICLNILVVASFTDAWIETKKEGEVASLNIESHLLQMRGLKQAFTLFA